MGLDMYAFKCDPRLLKSPVELFTKEDLGVPDDLREQIARVEAAMEAADSPEAYREALKIHPCQKIAQWRKHHDLHGWMESLYRKKGGEGDFNCQIVQLTIDDLNALDTAITYRKLPATTGFFFGNNPPDEASDEEDMAFIAKAREAIEQGFAVYYDSWW